MKPWNKNICRHIEKHCFYKDGKPLLRDSDSFAIKQLEKMNSGKKTILDFPCGSGRLLSLTNLEKDNYFGYDPSEEMLRLAEKKFPNFLFSEGTPGEQDFDIVFCCDLLQHLESEDAFKNKAIEIAGFGKRVIFHTWYTEEKKTKFRPLVLYGEKIPELWVSRDFLENEVLPALKEKGTVHHKYFADQKPYACVVIVFEKATKTKLKKEEVKVPEIVNDFEKVSSMAISVKETNKVIDDLEKSWEKRKEPESVNV